MKAIPWISFPIEAEAPTLVLNCGRSTHCPEKIWKKNDSNTINNSISMAVCSVL